MKQTLENSFSTLDNEKLIWWGAELDLETRVAIMQIAEAIGLIFRDNSKKIFYLPIGLMGIVIILEKGASRQLDRKNILQKIKSYQKNK